MLGGIFRRMFHPLACLGAIGSTVAPTAQRLLHELLSQELLDGLLDRLLVGYV
jgi:hypothetical protein